MIISCYNNGNESILIKYRETAMMTKKGLLNLLEKEAKEYRKETLVSIKRNNRMNNLTAADFKKIGTKTFKRLADAVLVDFINYVAAGQGIDLGLYTKHLKRYGNV